MKNFQKIFMAKIIKKTKAKFQKGFTLVESLIAITILMISIAAPLNLAGSGLIASREAENQIVAYYLAQDAMEAIINKKMTNQLKGNDMLYDFDLTKNYLTIDSTNLEIGSNTILFKTNDGIYKHSGSDNSGFSRYFNITKIGQNQAEIFVQVSWKSENGSEQTYELKSMVSEW